MKISIKPMKDRFLKTAFGKKLNYIYNFNQKVIDQFISDIRKEILPGARILDAGDGTVRYKRFFGDCTYLTHDFKQYADPNDKFEYGAIDFVSDIINIPVGDNNFDVIICTEVFEHIPRPDLAVNEFSRILKPGGRLFLTVPLGSGIHQIPFHFYGGFSRFWLEKYLGENGFDDISIMPKKRFFALYAQQTQRALYYLMKSDKITHIVLRPFYCFLNFILPLLFFKIDGYNLDKIDPLTEFTIGYSIKARKK